MGKPRSVFDSLPESEIIARVERATGRLTLNRPKALHALNRGMCQAMTEALMAWRDDPAVETVLIDHAGDRGFCAGGDIRMIAESGAGDGSQARAFFLTEYRLNHLLFEYPKPITAIVDGIVMGGGVGISEPADVRIATERTTYAMPETGIGLFPDVGGSWFLPRLPGQTGTWIALTGARLKAADTVALGIHSHFVPAERIPGLKTALLKEPHVPSGIVERFAMDSGPAPHAPHREAIDRLFGGERMEDIFSALEGDGSDWALAQLAVLRTKSPRSMRVTLRQLRLGAGLRTFVEAMKMEYRLGGRVIGAHDFQEGVRSVIVDKDGEPHWSPATLAGVSDAEVEADFAPLPPNEEWSVLP